MLAIRGVSGSHPDIGREPEILMQAAGEPPDGAVIAHLQRGIETLVERAARDEQVIEHGARFLGQAGAEVGLLHRPHQEPCTALAVDVPVPVPVHDVLTQLVRLGDVLLYALGQRQLDLDPPDVNANGARPALKALCPPLSLWSGLIMRFSLSTLPRYYP